MTCDPIGPYARIRLLPAPNRSALLLEARQGNAVRAEITALGESGGLEVGNTVLVDQRQLVTVGSEALIPLEAILARLG